MNFAALKSSYDADGFLVVRSFLSPAEMALLQGHLARFIGEVVPRFQGGEAFYEDKSRPDTLKQLNGVHRHDPFFAEYVKHPLWLSLAAALLGEPAWAHGAEWFNKPPNTQHITPPHQDNYYFCLTPPQVLTMWLALDTVDEENGCLRYVRGSHLRGLRPHTRTTTLGFSQGISDYGDADREQEVAMLAEPGDLLVHHGNTIHRANANRSSTRHRRSFAMVFQTDSCRRDEAAYGRYAQSSLAQQQEFGVKV